jgi:signal transduction histidine kinase
MTGKSTAKSIEEKSPRDTENGLQTLLVAAQEAEARADYKTAAALYAQLASGLDAKVEEQAAELQVFHESLAARNKELAIINNVQAGLADRLDLQSIYDLVGDTIVDIFQAQTVTIATADLHQKEATYWYAIENGRRLPLASAPFGPGANYLAAEKKPLYLRNPEEIKAFYPDLDATMMEGESAAAGSWLQVPLLIDGRLSGMISLEDQRPDAFSESDVRLLITLANSLTVAIENARLFDETQHLLSESQQRNAELAIINSVQEGLVAEMEMQAIYEIVGDKVVQIFDAQVVTINRLHQESRLNEYVYSFEHGRRGKIVLRPITPMIRDLLDHGEPTIVNFGTHEMRANGLIETVDGDDVLSYITAPLKRGDQVTGYVSVQNTERENAFEEADLRLLSTLVAGLSVALENARLFEETTHRAREMAALAEVGRDISATLDPSAVLERIAAHALELLNVSDSALFLPDETAGGDEPTMSGFVALGPIAEQVKATTVRPGQGILGHIWQTRLPEMLNSVSHDARALTITGTQKKEEERLMVAPLLSGDEVTGLMAVWRTGKAFDQDDLQFLNGLARQAAIAIKNARLYSDAELARAAAIRANESKSAFLSNMSHELRTPLNAVIGFTRIVQRKSKDLLPQKQLDNLDKVLSSSEHLLTLINTILDIAKIEAGRMDVVESNFQVEAMVEYLAMTMQPLLRSGVVLKTDIAPDLPLLLSDQDKVKQILLNLLSNAAKFTHEGSITIRAHMMGNQDGGALRESPHLAIEVADTGIGVNEEALARIFEEFQQADDLTRRHYGGTGLGLSISKQLAQLLGGDLKAKSRYGEGSTFTLYLPLEQGKQESA